MPIHLWRSSGPPAKAIRFLAERSSPTHAPLTQLVRSQDHYSLSRVDGAQSSSIGRDLRFVFTDDAITAGPLRRIKAPISASHEIKCRLAPTELRDTD